METGQPPASSVPEDLSVAVLILNWNGRFLLQTCLPPLLNQSYTNYKVVVVDNGSSDDSVPFVRQQFPQVRLIQNEENLGFSRGTNAGLRQISADVVVLLNNDVLVRPNWLAERPFDPPAISEADPAQTSGPSFWNTRRVTIFTIRKQTSMVCRRCRMYRTSPGPPWQYTTPFRQKLGCWMKVSILFTMRKWITATGPERLATAWWWQLSLVAVHNESTSMRRVQDIMLQTRHRNRYSFVLKHYSLDQFLQEFVPAETAYLNTHHLFPDVDAVRLACLEIAIAAPTILPVETTAEQVTAVQKALLQLRETAVRSTASAETSPPELEEFSFPHQIP